MLYFIFLKDFIYLFMMERERGRDTGRGRSRTHAGSLMWDSITGLQDHGLGWSLALDCWATRGISDVQPGLKAPVSGSPLIVFLSNPQWVEVLIIGPGSFQLFLIPPYPCPHSGWNTLAQLWLLNSYASFKTQFKYFFRGRDSFGFPWQLIASFPISWSTLHTLESQLLFF